MTTNPANSPLAASTQPAPALGGPVPPFRVLLVNGNGRGRRAALGFLLHTAVVAVLFLFPLLMTEEIVGSPALGTTPLGPYPKGSPTGTTKPFGPKPSGPKPTVADEHNLPELVLPNSPIKRTSGDGGIQTAGPDIGSIPFGIPEGIEGGEPAAAPSRSFQQPFVPLPVAPSPVRVGGRVREPKLLRRVEPDYPLLAKQAGIQGTVVLEATLGTNGRVEHIAVVSGHPLLVESAQRAVAQWVYEPTYLNDRPVPVLLRVTVEFILRR